MVKSKPFVLIALSVFFIVKAVNRLYRQQEAAPTPPTKTEELLTEIRDLLAKQ